MGKQFLIHPTHFPYAVKQLFKKGMPCAALPSSRARRSTHLPLLMNLVISLGNEIWFNEIALLEHSFAQTTSWLKMLSVICVAVHHFTDVTVYVYELCRSGGRTWWKHMIAWNKKSVTKPLTIWRHLWLLNWQTVPGNTLMASSKWSVSVSDPGGIRFSKASLLYLSDTRLLLGSLLMFHVGHVWCSFKNL